MTKEQKLEFSRDWIKKLDSQYTTINKDRQEAIKFCNGDPSIVTVIKGRSQLVTTDMQDAIDAAMPDILEVIAGTDEPLKLDPVGKEDVEPTKKLQILSNVMIRRKNKWFRLCSDFLDDSMKLKIGFFKYRWVKEEKNTEKEYEGIEDFEIQNKLQISGTSILSDEITKDGIRKTIINYRIVDEYVKIDGVPSERLRFPIDTRSFDNPAFVVEEIRLYEHEFKQLYSNEAFNKVKEVIDSFESDSDTVTKERYKDVGGLNYLYDKDTGQYKAYECYFPDKDTGVPWIFVFSGEEVLVDEKNKYKKPPYRGGSPFLLAHRLIGQGYLDRLKEIQRQRTDYKRMIFDWIRMGLFRRYFLNVQSNINMDDYLNHNASNAVIRSEGPINAGDLVPEERAQLLPEVFNFWETMNIEKDYHIPTPRSYSGINPEVLNKTFRGQAQQIGQASKKLLMMIRAYMEDVFGPLFQDVLDCIGIFMQKKTSIRYLNEDYEITPDNIIGNFDIIVNIGLGVHDKDAMTSKLQQLIGLSLQQTDIITPQNRHYMMQELVKVMGFLNTTDFVTDPNMKMAIMQLIQGIMIHLNGMQEAGVKLPDTEILLQLIAQAAQAIGLPMGNEQNQGGANTEGTFPGQNTAAIQEQPMQTREPVLTPDGGGEFFG